MTFRSLVISVTQKTNRVKTKPPGNVFVFSFRFACRALHAKFSLRRSCGCGKNFLKFLKFLLFQLRSFANVEWKVFYFLCAFQRRNVSGLIKKVSSTLETVAAPSAINFRLLLIVPLIQVPSTALSRFENLSNANLWTLFRLKHSKECFSGKS
jgi:hypothetical protein